jgi:hypothetical protein
MNLEGKIAAGADAVVICGCPMGTNRLISPAGQWMETPQDQNPPGSDHQQSQNNTPKQPKRNALV